MYIFLKQPLSTLTIEVKTIYFTTHWYDKISYPKPYNGIKEKYNELLRESQTLNQQL